MPTIIDMSDGGQLWARGPALAWATSTTLFCSHFSLAWVIAKCGYATRDVSSKITWLRVALLVEPNYWVLP
jgi:hypothetical protein